MKEQIVSKAYAQSIFELGKEANVNVADELTKLTEVVNNSNDLETLLFLDVFTAEEKLTVLNEIFSKLGTSALVRNFTSFLLQEQRMGIFPMIFKDVIVLDDHERGFLKGTIEGSDDQVDPAFKESVKKFLQEKLGKEVELDYQKTGAVTAGYRVTVEDFQLDASLDNQLGKLKEEILGN